MAEDQDNTAAEATPAAADAAAPALKTQILGQFIRDMSFENIVAQKGVAGEGAPQISVQVALDARKRPVEHQFEVATKLNVTSKSADGAATLFVLELDYAGIFHIENLPDDQMHPYLMIECPRLLFPFLRRIVNDLTRDGGFPPLNLDMIDWVSLYRQDIARRAEALKAEGAAAPKMDA